MSIEALFKGTGKDFTPESPGPKRTHYNHRAKKAASSVPYQAVQLKQAEKKTPQKPCSASADILSDTGTSKHSDNST